MADRAQRVDAIEVEMSRRLLELRKSQGLTQEKLATAAGMYQATIYKIETGTRRLRYGEAVVLFDALGEPLDGWEGQICRACFDNPPAGFTCNTCGAKGAGQ